MLRNGLHELLQTCSGQVLQSATAVACMKEACNDRRSAHAAVPAATRDALHSQHRRRLQSGLSGAKACSDDSVDLCRESHAGLGLRHQRTVCAEQLPVLVPERNLGHPAHACREGGHCRYSPSDSLYFSHACVKTGTVTSKCSAVRVTFLATTCPRFRAGAWTSRSCMP